MAAGEAAAGAAEVARVWAAEAEAVPEAETMAKEVGMTVAARAVAARVVGWEGAGAVVVRPPVPEAARKAVGRAVERLAGVAAEMATLAGAAMGSGVGVGAAEAAAATEVAALEVEARAEEPAEAVASEAEA